MNRRSRRLGDFASGTIVVRLGGRRTWSSLPFLTGSSTEQSRGYALSSADASLVRDFLVRRGGMHPPARAELAQRLAVAVARRYHLPLDAGGDPERFLEDLSV
jgi:hypothetical protein